MRGCSQSHRPTCSCCEQRRIRGNSLSTLFPAAPSQVWEAASPGRALLLPPGLPKMQLWEGECSQNHTANKQPQHPAQGSLPSPCPLSQAGSAGRALHGTAVALVTHNGDTTPAWPALGCGSSCTAFELPPSSQQAESVRRLISLLRAPFAGSLCWEEKLWSFPRSPTHFNELSGGTPPRRLPRIRPPGSPTPFKEASGGGWTLAACPPRPKDGHCLLGIFGEGSSVPSP